MRGAPGRSHSDHYHDTSQGRGVYRRCADGALESGEATLQWTVGGRSGRELAVNVDARHEDLLQPFRIPGDLLVPTGAHEFVTGRISYAPAQAALLRLSASAEAGTFFDWGARPRRSRRHGSPDGTCSSPARGR